MRVWVAIWVGSTVICRAIAAWIAGGVALKLIIIGVVAGFVKGLPWTTNITLALAAAWLVTAIVLGLRAPALGEEPDPGGEPSLPTRDQLATALHTVGAPHAHVSALADHLGTPTDRVREALAAARIPVSGGVRMKGRPVAVSPGVKAGDFPPLPSPGQEVAAGGVLTSNNNSNNSEGEGAREGMSIIQDEVNPRRWHVLRRARS